MDNDYSAQDFKSLFFNVYGIGEHEDVMLRFPILRNYPVFRAKLVATLPFVKVFRYIVFAFDKNTPLIALNDIMKIRNYAAQLAGFSLRQNGKFDPVVEDMLYSRNELVNRMIIQFCVIAEGDEYATYVTFTEALRKENENLLNSKDEESTGRSKIINNINTLRNEIKQLRKTFLSADRDTLLERSLYNFVDAQNLGLSPEAYAEKLNISKNPIHAGVSGEDQE